MAAKKEPKLLKLVYEQNLEDRRTFSTTFIGPWSRMELDRVHRLLVRELKHHKRELRREEDARREA